MTLSDRFRDGRDFILSAPTTVPALWGGGGNVLWAAGEPLLICGPQGVGKSTILQQLAFARTGILAPELIGFPVEPAPRRVLYIAADRPRQIARSMRRMACDEHADLLAERLVVWEGPLPFNLVKEPEALAVWVAEAEVSDVYIDSLKDIMPALTTDEAGLAYSAAIGAVIAARIEVAVNHHQRKANNDNKKPSALADVYGSTWITSGAGSVICLWGQAGDPLVELSHLKQPAEEIGPLDLMHDHERGRTTRRERPDAWTLLQGATVRGITAQAAAAAIYAAPSKGDIEKVRRRLDRFVADGFAVMTPAGKITEPNVYRPIARNGRVSVRDPGVSASRDAHAGSRNAPNAAHAALTNAHAGGSAHDPLKEWGDRDQGGGTAGDPLDALAWDADASDDEREHLGYGTSA